MKEGQDIDDQIVEFLEEKSKIAYQDAISNGNEATILKGRRIVTIQSDGSEIEIGTVKKVSHKVKENERIIAL